MIDPGQARLIALSSSCEDYWGLYELIWEFNSAFPDATDVEKADAAAAAIHDLLGGGLITLFRASWPPVDFIEVSQSRAAGIIADPSSWMSPAESADGAFFAFAATSAGEVELSSPSGDARPEA